MGSNQPATANLRRKDGSNGNDARTDTRHVGTGRVGRPRSSDGSLWRVIRTIKATSKREVKAALAELEAAVAAGKVSLDDMTFAELLERWMEHIAGLGRADTTLYHYRQYIEREIGPVLGAIVCRS